MEADEALVAQIRKGDLAAFDRLYERYEGRLFAYLRAMAGSRADAEEILHDAFLTVLRDTRADFGHEGAFRAWLFRVGRNLALNQRRATSRHERNVAAAPVVTTDGRADLALEVRELEDALTAAVRRLPVALGELWHLRTSGLSYEQIASVVDVPVGTVKSRMHQMVCVLREELKPWIAPE